MSSDPAVTIITENWLTRKPDSRAGLAVFLWTLFLAAASIAYWTDAYNLSHLMTATRSQVFELHEYWRAWTTLLVHADGKHLLGNAALFFVLGFFLMGYFGIWLIPLTGFAFGGLINFIVLSEMPAEVQLVGVSGVVLWFAGAWLLLYFLLETRRSWLQRALRSAGVGLALFMPSEAFDPSISYKSHLWGFLLGIGWAGVYFLIKKKPLQQAEVRMTIVEEADQLGLGAGPDGSADPVIKSEFPI